MSNDQKKRVVTLLRVSTKKQVTDDDIPLQRKECMDFIAKQPDWEFVGEYSEKGISGFKMKASEREVLEQLKEDALNKKFDVVLVYMFDRLGRIDEETPFVLKWFVDHGIEMWSTKEGQRKFDTHTDNLLNYITFWLAAGESKKTQIRTLSAKQEMRNQGRYQGCPAPYGYMHISTGEHNSKGREVKKMVINEEEAEIIKTIFNLATESGYGTRRIANYLNERNIPTKRGVKWAGSTIAGMLKNSIYKGYFMYGRRKDGVYKSPRKCEVSPIKNEDLVIISEEQWEKAQQILISRMNEGVKNSIPRNTKGPLLFTGFIYCKKCKSRLTLHYSCNHHRRKDGTINRNKRPYYICYGKASGLLKCPTKNFAASRIEGTVMDMIYEHLDALGNAEFSDEYIAQQIEHIKEYDKKIKEIKDKIKVANKDIDLLKGEILNVIKGISLFTQELLLEQIDDKTKKIELLNEELKTLEEEQKNRRLDNEDLVKLKNKIPTWKENFEAADLEQRKMMLADIIERIEVDDDYIELTLSINIKTLESCIEKNSQHNAKNNDCCPKWRRRYRFYGGRSFHLCIQ